MDHEEQSPPSFSLARRWGAGLNLIITVAALLAIAAMVNYLAIRHYGRFHVVKETPDELSPRTRQVLASLTNDVKVITFMNSRGALFPHVRALLREYQFANPHIQVQHVDYLLDAAEANLVATEYKLTNPGDKDVIIFDSGKAKKIVNATETSDYDYSNLLTGKSREVYRTHFKGEILFTSAIYEVTSERQPKAYFLLGHNERLPTDTDAQAGFSRFGDVLALENNFQVGLLDLTGQREIPADCNLLIIAGPLTPIEDAQLEKIQRYLDQGGRMLVTFDFRTVMAHRQTGLERLLRNWGVAVSQNIIWDADNAGNATGIDPLPVTPGAHPTVNSLGNARVHMFQPRSLRALDSDGRGDTQVDELLFTGPNSKEITYSAENRRNPEKPVGAQPLMVAVEKSIPGLQRGSTRIVVVGDTTFWSNQWMQLDANEEFAAYVVNWLVGQNILLADIPRQALKTYKLTMTRSQMRNVRLLLLGAMPAAVLLIGFIVALRRRT